MQTEKEKKREMIPRLTVDNWLNTVSYAEDKNYVPSNFALEFVNFIKLVNGGAGEENKTPVLHYRILDNIASIKKNLANMLFRGSAKTTIVEYLFLYLGVFGFIPNFGEVPLAIYVSDSIDNGVKNMRKNLEHRYENSDFLKTYIIKIKFTDTRWEFTNAEGKTFIVKGYGAATGVRGTKEMGIRPILAVLDDLISDADAKSPAVIAAVEDTVHNAVNYALHPNRSKIIWNGTPFNSKDPLYKAVESGAWWVNAYPVCEQFPCDKKEFRGAWEDRFSYSYVKGEYEKAVAMGRVDSFNQELMLRIMSDEERLILDGDIIWYRQADVLEHKGRYNFYITTDFATAAKESADFSVISVWALNNNGDWMWVDGICKKQLMDKNIDDLFRLVQKYKPLEVGIEVSGQQGGFIPWIIREMGSRNIYFNLASEGNNSKPGIRPNTNKMQRFMVVLPWFKTHKIWFPKEKEKTPELQEALTEIRLACIGSFKSKNDDFLDTVSMLANLKYWKPSAETQFTKAKEKHHDMDLWEMNEREVSDNPMESYIV